MSFHQKAPLTRTLNAFAQQKAMDEIEKSGASLPGHVLSVSGALITVNFDVVGGTFPQVTMPLFGPEYIRYPIRAGDKGFAIAARATLSQVSGLGTAQADIVYQRGNLSNLCWMPVGKKGWAAVQAGYLVMYGPSGVIIQDVATVTPTTYLKLTTGEIQLVVGAKSLVINSGGITLDGVLWDTHVHPPGTYEVDSQPVVGLSGSPQAP